MSWTILVIVAAVVLFGVAIYNRLVAGRNRYKNAFAQIDVQLTRRHDLIPNLVETAKGYIKHERETLEAVVNARNAAVSGLKAAAEDPTDPAAMRRLAEAEQGLSGALGRLFALAEAYPDLKANQNMMQLSEELTTTENKVALPARHTTMRSWSTTHCANPSRTTSWPGGSRSGRQSCWRSRTPASARCPRSASEPRPSGVPAARVNFFEHQDRARRQSRRLIARSYWPCWPWWWRSTRSCCWWRVTAPSRGGAADTMLNANLPLLGAGAIATTGVVGLASLFRIASLRSGGGQVARQLGGTLVDSDTRDFKRSRLRNVVEEIALASGVPVPEIYVLEQESGINAFAAGYTPADAAVAVTRGALEKLDRDELQGVIAHEFSHVLNGDMRLNIRLMGMLFGILLLALIGRRVLLHARFGRSSKNGAAVLLIAAGLMMVGYVGLFFGRWIKAAVSRQREYLADASAVQFTRDPGGIGDALKKIAVYSDGSYLKADSEEVSHMLFGDGQRMMLFSTHPPLHERIRRIDPGFRPAELEDLAASVLRERSRDREEVEHAAKHDAARGARDVTGGLFDAGRLIEQIGKPDWQRMLTAAAVTASLPDNIRRAAHSISGRRKCCCWRCSTATRSCVSANCWPLRSAWD
jgi:Zn-dependent protease with chaperone function